MNRLKCKGQGFFRDEKAAMGFEPMNIGFANQRLSPLGHAAVQLLLKCYF